jgi:hypothetical protein
MKKIIIILLFYLSGITQSCCDKKADTVYYDFTTANFRQVNYQLNGHYIDYTFLDDSTLNPLSFGMLVDLVYSGVYSYQVPSLFINTVRADAFLQCPSAYYEPKNKIKAISILTSKFFNENHPTNSDVIEYFNSYFGTDRVMERISQKDLIKRLNAKQSYGPDQEICDFVYVLTKAPDNDTMKFEVVIKLADGAELRHETNNIVIVNK